MLTKVVTNEGITMIMLYCFRHNNDDNQTSVQCVVLCYEVMMKSNKENVFASEGFVVIRLAVFFIDTKLSSDFLDEK